MASADGRRKIVAVANDMVGGRVDLLEGCRTIGRLQMSLPDADQFDDDVLTFVGVASELEDVPTSAARQYWSPEYLRELDRQKVEFFRAAIPSILRSCRSLMARWGGEACR